MREYIITIDDWFFKYVHERYTHFFGCPIEEIVRCKDCIRFNERTHYCPQRDFRFLTRGDGFCAWGERRDA